MFGKAPAAHVVFIGRAAAIAFQTFGIIGAGRALVNHGFSAVAGAKP